MKEKMMILAVVFLSSFALDQVNADPRRECQSKNYQEKKVAFAECTKKYEADKNNEKRKACLREAELQTKNKNKKCDAL